jgi:hypothetical protein
MKTKCCQAPEQNHSEIFPESLLKYVTFSKDIRKFCSIVKLYQSLSFNFLSSVVIMCTYCTQDTMLDIYNLCRTLKCPFFELPFYNHSRNWVNRTSMPASWHLFSSTVQPIQRNFLKLFIHHRLAPLRFTISLDTRISNGQLFCLFLARKCCPRNLWAASSCWSTLPMISSHRNLL